MSLRRSLLFRIALMLLVTLPLRANAATEGCGSMPSHETTMTVMAAEASDHPVGHAGAPMGDHVDHGAAHGTCSVCCCAAVIASESFHWRAPGESRIAPPPIVLLATPVVSLGGLERPPRAFST